MKRHFFSALAAFLIGGALSSVAAQPAQATGCSQVAAAGRYGFWLDHHRGRELA
jgi:hypothetical protein